MPEWWSDFRGAEGPPIGKLRFWILGNSGALQQQHQQGESNCKLESTSMRTRCLPLNEEESWQAVSCCCCWCCLWGRCTVQSEKRRWQSHEILVNFQLQTNLFVFPAQAQQQQQKQQKKPQSKTKTSWQIWLPKLGLKAQFPSGLVWLGLVAQG